MHSDGVLDKAFFNLNVKRIENEEATPEQVQWCIDYLIRIKNGILSIQKDNRKSASRS